MTVGVETIFGNSIWGSVKRRGSALNEPILMDEYSAGIDSRTAPGNVLVIEFEAKPQDKDMKRELKDKDIDLKDLTNSAFRIQMKNEESAGWLVDSKGPEGRCKGGSIQALFPEGGGLDLDKPVVVQGFRADSGWTIPLAGSYR